MYRESLLNLLSFVIAGSLIATTIYLTIITEKLVPFSDPKISESSSGKIVVILLDKFISPGDLMKFNVHTPNEYISIHQIEIIPIATNWSRKIVYKNAAAPSWDETIEAGSGPGDSVYFDFRVPNDPGLLNKTITLQVVVDYIFALQQYPFFYNVSSKSQIEINVLLLTSIEKQNLIHHHKDLESWNLKITIIYLLVIIFFPVFYSLFELKLLSRLFGQNIYDPESRTDIIVLGSSISLSLVVFALLAHALSRSGYVTPFLCIILCITGFVMYLYYKFMIAFISVLILA